MAITTALSAKELQRVAQSCYEGKYARISLAAIGQQSYTTETLVSDWDSIKVSGNGYTDFIGLIATGSYDTGDARYEMPELIAEFTATGSGYNFNRVYVVLATPLTFNISTAALTDNVATITTSASHGFATGKTVVISGATNSVFNGTYAIASTPSPNTFTYARINTNISSGAVTGTASQLNEEQYLHSLITESPGILVSPAQTITYKIQFCTDD